ncbi:MAG TPA: glycosyltransferase family 2 protein [Chlamydiales bacterium]|nr:glycosyltransferase family 2 protein [Chlamydiales bacterium]
MISVTILTKNSSRYIQKVLEALLPLPEVAILDTGSEDDTIQIATQFPNVTCHKGRLVGFGEAHNLITSLAKHDWILSIDSDEVASKGLVEEILSTTLNADTIYSISRHNYYRDKLIKGCGWYPDRVVRLYNRKKTRFSDAKVHEAIIKEGCQLAELKNPLLHYPYNSIDDFLKKMQLYSRLFAEQYAGKKKAGMTTAIGHGFFAFLKSYLIKQGALYGSEGFEISLYNAITAYYKYLKLRDMNEQHVSK